MVDGRSMSMQASCRGSSSQKPQSERETKASTAGSWHTLSSSQLLSRRLAWPWPWPGLVGPLWTASNYENHKGMGS
ncbi:hypothetical protein LI328DRAFT_33836 [Trichoderma asperelloides]|nr:hypothetical protein LI328DRAFT_33836 [Trichoderma asperelloides]